MARYKNADNTQGLFLTINLYDQLVPYTFEWTLNYLIDKADISLFDLNYKNDEKGASAYSPRVLLKVIMYCYSIGIISSRKIERACINNIIVKSLAANNEPDHDTIATFITVNHEAIKDLFTQVLLQCSRLGLITGEMYSVDGCKLPSNASKEWSGTIAELTKKRDKLKQYIGKLIVRHNELDKDEDAKEKLEPFRQTMGEDNERRERCIERLEKKLERLNKFLETAKPRNGVSGEEIKSNITDNESAFIKSPHGYIQGYNGITVADSGNQIIVSAEAVGSGPESGSFPKMLDSLNENMKEITGKKNPLKDSIITGDTGFFTEENLQEANERKIEVLIPDQQFRQRDPDFGDRKEHGKKNIKYTIEDFEYDKKNNCYKCPAGNTLEYKGEAELRNNSGKRYQAKRADCKNCSLIDKCISKRTAKNPVRTIYIANKKYKTNLSEKMRIKIDDPVYREIYSRRMQIIEPVFSDITYCKGMNRFTLRGENKVDIQWKLYCMVHNIGKCIKPLGQKTGA